ncbi:MAG TPA: OpgC domain-containing protein [Thermoanaerobaculia bacterium]|nr:OpgC domain-containing protein [Thermoanaerobaculia bacterium]
MHLPYRIAACAGFIVIVGFSCVVLWRVLTGEVSLKGLLNSKAPGDRRSLSPARLQLLIISTVIAVGYLHAVIVSPRWNALPRPPGGVIAVLGGSQAVYLAAKALSFFIQPLLKNLRQGDLR